MRTARLFLSFWHLGLDNLPQGTFRRRKITAHEAKRSIETARKNRSLLCVSKDDLVAPYSQYERDQHAALRQLLQDSCGIVLSLEDFLTPEDIADGCYTINPLVFAEVQGDDRLIVVTCMYAWIKDRSARATLKDSFIPDPSTVTFHVIEAISPNAKVLSTKT